MQDCWSHWRLRREQLASRDVLRSTRELRAKPSKYLQNEIRRQRNRRAERPFSLGNSPRARPGRADLPKARPISRRLGASSCWPQITLLLDGLKPGFRGGLHHIRRDTTHATVVGWA